MLCVYYSRTRKILPEIPDALTLSDEVEYDGRVEAAQVSRAAWRRQKSDCDTPPNLTRRLGNWRSKMKIWKPLWDWIGGLK